MKRISLLLLALTACTIESPDESGGDVDPVDQGPDAGPGPVEEPPQLRIDPTVTTTNYYTVPVSGKGPASGSLLVNTTERGSYSTTIGPDGCFCVDVPLTQSASNTLTFKAMNDAAQYSEEVSLAVTQSGTPPGSPSPPTRTMLSRNGTVHDTTLSEREGTTDALTDGNVNTWVDLENAIFDDDWIAIKLGQRGLVDFIRVRSRPECPMQEYRLFISDVDNPGEAVHEATDWKHLFLRQNGDGDDAIQLFTPTAAKYVGIQFLSDDCYGPISNHLISEVEVISPLSSPPNAPAVPSCATQTRTCQ